MQAGHLLLGRPWQFDRETKHDGRTNLYSLVHEKRKYTLAPLSPSQVHEMQTKLSKEVKVSGSNLYINSGCVIEALNVQTHLATNDLQEEVSAGLEGIGLPTKVLDKFGDTSSKEKPLGLPFIKRIGQHIISHYGLSKDEYVQRLYQHVQELTTSERFPHKHQAKEKCKEMILEPSGLHIRPEMFLHQRRGDGSLKTKEHISNNSLEPPGKIDTCSKFKVTNLAPLNVGKTVLRTKLSQGGGDDVDLQTAIVPKVKDTPKKSSKLREPSHSAHDENDEMGALLIQELVDEDLEKLHSFSHGFGFIPCGFPSMVFNEAIAQGPSPHVSYLALEQESKGAHHPPLLEASPYPYMDSLVPFVNMGFDSCEVDILWVEATAPTEPIQGSTTSPNIGSKSSSGTKKKDLLMALNKLLQVLPNKPFVDLFTIFLFQPLKCKPK